MLQVKTTSDLTGCFFASPKIPSGFAGNWTDLDLDSTSSGAVFFFVVRVVVLWCKIQHILKRWPYTIVKVGGTTPKRWLNKGP